MIAQQIAGASNEANSRYDQLLSPPWLISIVKAAK
jgi:hypothetical protein